MALTQEQSTALQEAIDNLNKSVSVNEEVLNIIKSVGNTGAVDIATHDNDLNAHPEFNDLYAKGALIVGAKNFQADGTTPASARTYTQSSGKNGAGIYETFAFTDGTVNYCGTIRFNYVHPASQSGVLSAGQMYARKYNASTTNYDVTHSFVFSIDNLGNRGAYIGLVNSDSTIQQFRFTFNQFYGENGTDLGSSTYQWKDCYLQNSPIVSSDRRLKQNFESVPEAVFKAWASVNFQVYKFKEAVAKKGEANARKHVGLVAQDIIEAFEAKGLNAFDYGIVCHDSWEDQYVDEQVIDAEAVYDKDGKIVTPEKSHTEKRFVKAAGDVYTVRYEEALALEAAYQRWKLSKIEQALAAKGITL